MTDIIIRGMEMPKDGYVYIEMLLKVADGKVYYNYTGEKKVYAADFLTLPEGHGRLIDADKLMKEEQVINRFHVVSACDVIIAPTIVPADVTDIDVWNKKEGGTDDG